MRRAMPRKTRPASGLGRAAATSDPRTRDADWRSALLIVFVAPDAVLDVPGLNGRNGAQMRNSAALPRISSCSPLNQWRMAGLLGRMVTELIGWAAAVILTIGRQVYTQWRAETTAGVSKWLFIGQVSASTGFVVYSGLKHDWVFVATNAVMLATAILGQGVYLRNRRKKPCNDRPRGAKKPYSVRG